MDKPLFGFGVEGGVKLFTPSFSKDFFSSIGNKGSSDLLAIGVKRLFRKDEMIFHVGSSSDDVYILLNGRVKVFELSQEGKEVILWFCFPGELFGLSEVMRRDHRLVNALACCPVEVLAIKQADFEQYLYANPASAMQVIELLSSRLRELGDVLLHLASDDVTSRVVKLIARLANRYGTCNSKGIRLDIPLTHQEMADMIGASRQTVTTVLGALKKQGLLRTEQRTIYIENLQWIESFANKETGRKLSQQQSA
ncbi:MAG: Crp/Fnr family transcriptional regulator [Gammaproteobacteria bacterium]|nr:Crp/Fnr family transcriptional regulator [Gammaproteobacteria bacterium]MDH5801424.1 Crp/Fnr family transcriptional regulator [Gammaproteobacteria bacterium]